MHSKVRLAALFLTMLLTILSKLQCGCHKSEKLNDIVAQIVDVYSA